MNLIIDIGNSFYKCGEFNGQNLVQEFTFDDSSQFKNYVKKSNFEKAIVSSVSNDNLEFLLNDSRVYFFNHTTKIPIISHYKTPETLGLDRLAVVIGAHKIFPQKDCLIFDCGTCITFDFITSEGIYKGGGIALGLQMKFKALNNFTAKLPLVQHMNHTNLIGVTTETSIQSGVINGTIAEISGIIQKFKNISDNLATVLCGGDSNFLSTQLEEVVELEKNLVLIGLNEVLNFNA